MINHLFYSPKQIKEINKLKDEFKDKKEIELEKNIKFLQNLFLNKMNQKYSNKISTLLHNSKSETYRIIRNNINKAIFSFDDNNKLCLTLPKNFLNKNNKSFKYFNNNKNNNFFPIFNLEKNHKSLNDIKNNNNNNIIQINYSKSNSNLIYNIKNFGNNNENIINYNFDFVKKDKKLSPIIKRNIQNKNKKIHKNFFNTYNNNNNNFDNDINSIREKTKFINKLYDINYENKRIFKQNDLLNFANQKNFLNINKQIELQNKQNKKNKEQKLLLERKEKLNLMKSEGEKLNKLAKELKFVRMRTQRFKTKKISDNSKLRKTFRSKTVKQIVPIKF